MTPPRIYRRSTVSAVTGLPRSTIYLRIKQGTFPKPIELGSKFVVGWVASEVDAWVDAQIQRSRAGTQPLAGVETAAVGA